MYLKFLMNDTQCINILSARKYIKVQYSYARLTNWTAAR